MKTKLMTLFALIVWISAPALSQGRDRYHDDRWDDDSFCDPIEEGWRHGKLTRDEIRLLELQEDRIREVRRWMLRDGHLDRWERRKLQKMYREFNEELWKQKNDRDRRHRRH
jgi:hypothetical protein